MAGKAKSPCKARLKVFRTPIGFHDAYVAAPSRKAALQAWGTDKDLFARGVAEEVTDPAITAEPLAAPGTVFRQMRAMPPEEVEAGPGKSGKPKAPRAAPERPLRRIPPPPPPPPPSSQQVDEAQAALDAAGEQQQIEQRDLAARERELASERKAMEKRQATELRRLESRLAAAQEDHATQLAAWQKAVGKSAVR